MVYSVSVNLFHRKWIRHIYRVLCKSLEPLLISLYFAKNMGNACFDIHSCTETISGYASVNSRWIGCRARTISLVLCQVLAGFFFVFVEDIAFIYRTYILLWYSKIVANTSSLGITIMVKSSLYLSNHHILFYRFN